MEIQSIFKKVYLWMFVGVLITFITGYSITMNDELIKVIFLNGIWFWTIIIEFILVIAINAAINKISSNMAKFLFIVYSFVTGITFGSVFVVYELTSIILVFAITASLFLILAILGYTTKIDLTKFGPILFVSLIGILFAYLANMFIGSNAFDMLICIFGVIVFMSYIAYDIQKIKRMAYQMEISDKTAILGALELYLDFINLFLRLLRLFAKNKD